MSRNTGKPYSDEENERIRAGARRLLEKMGSKTALARELGVAQPTVSDFMNGKSGVGPAVARKIAVLLGVTLEELTQGRERVAVTDRQDVAARHPDWSEREEEALPRFRAVDPEKVDRARMWARALMMSALPEVLTVDFVAKLIDAGLEAQAGGDRVPPRRRSA